ncbi:hypothetical protein E4U55_000082 [Claviceps digitariae]|nr:hypothetical protein E4U55_000082 [Claviceps digitariae]
MNQAAQDNTSNHAQVRLQQLVNEPIGWLDRLPPEILVQALLLTDFYSLNNLRRVNRRAKNFVESMTQFAAVAKHYPELLRISFNKHTNRYPLSRFNCHEAFAILSTANCASCKERFGAYLDLVNCRRSCGLCASHYQDDTRRWVYIVRIRSLASSFFVPDGTIYRNALVSRHHLHAADTSDASPLPGCFCVACSRRSADRKCFAMFKTSPAQDASGRQPVVVNDQVNVGHTELYYLVDSSYLGNEAYYVEREFMTAPYLLDSGKQSDWGYLCLGCKKTSDGEVKRHLRGSYTREGMLKHIEKYGPLVEDPDAPGKFIHDS